MPKIFKADRERELLNKMPGYCPKWVKVIVIIIVVAFLICFGYAIYVNVEPKYF